MAARNKKIQPLTDKEEAFLENYLVSWNGADAARKAGYEPKQARFIAHQLLTKLYILQAIEERMKALRMATDEWYARATEHARGDLGELLNDDGSINLKKARQENKLRLVSEYQVETYSKRDEDGNPTPCTKIKIKLYSAQKALEFLGQRIAMPDGKAALLEAQVLMLQSKLEELQKKEVLLAFLQKNASPDIYQEVLRLLTGGAASGGKEDPGISLDWNDTQEDKEEAQPAEAPPSPTGDRG